MSRQSGDQNNKSGTTWTSTQAYTLAIVCLAAGLAFGYLFRGSARPSGTTTAGTGQNVAAGTQQMSPGQIVDPGGSMDSAQTAEMVDKTAAPMLAEAEKNPNNAGGWVRIGNLYYDAHIYPKAIEYYERSLKVDSKNPDVITDLGTAYFYSGNADQALKEFNRALQVRPNHPMALFNTGIVRWQGKNDPKGAVQAWEQLLKTNPGYPERDRVQELIDRAKQHGKG